MSRFESVQRPSVIGFLIVLEIVIGPTNSSQSDTLQIKSHILVIQTDWCYIWCPPKPLMGNQVKHLLIILSSLFCAILFIVLFCIETATAQEPFIISSESLERIPPKHLNFLEGFDHDVPLETLENAEWTEKLMSAQSIVEGYWVRFVVQNNVQPTALASITALIARRNYTSKTRLE